MKLEIVRTYASDDIEFKGDAYEVSLMVRTSGKAQILLRGDWYHDHIEDKIEGFLAALSFMKVSYEVVETSLNDEEYDDGYGENEDESISG